MVIISNHITELWCPLSNRWITWKRQLKPSFVLFCHNMRTSHFPKWIAGGILRRHWLIAGNKHGLISWLQLCNRLTMCLSQCECDDSYFRENMSLCDSPDSAVLNFHLPYYYWIRSFPRNALGNPSVTENRRWDSNYIPLAMVEIGAVSYLLLASRH